MFRSWFGKRPNGHILYPSLSPFGTRSCFHEGVVGRFVRVRRVITCAALAATAFLALGVGSASAKSCGSRVIDDWYADGTIDRAYRRSATARRSDGSPTR